MQGNLVLLGLLRMQELGQTHGMLLAVAESATEVAILHQVEPAAHEHLYAVAAACVTQLC
jgi:hypothetical protein